MELEAACGAGAGRVVPFVLSTFVKRLHQLRARVDVRAVARRGMKLRQAQRSAAARRVSGAGPRAPGRTAA